MHSDLPFRASIKISHRDSPHVPSRSFMHEDPHQDPSRDTRPVLLSPDAWAGEVRRKPAPGRAVMPDRGSSKMRSESFDVLLAEARRARQEKPRARREPSPRSPCRLRRTFSRCEKRGSAGPRRVACARRLFLAFFLRGFPHGALLARDARYMSFSPLIHYLFLFFFPF